MAPCVEWLGQCFALYLLGWNDGRLLLTQRFVELRIDSELDIHQSRRRKLQNLA